MSTCIECVVPESLGLSSARLGRIRAYLKDYVESGKLPGNTDLAGIGQKVFSEMPFDGIGFGLGFSVVLDPAKSGIIGSPGEYAWGGAASTAFWIDPVEDMSVLFLTQLMPSSSYPIRRDLRVLSYQALVD